MDNLNSRNIKEFLQETDALTYLNAMKVTMAELKEELTTIEETKKYINLSCERAKKAIRRLDSQYRLIVKLALDENTPIQTVELSDDIVENELQELMEEEGLGQ